MTARPEGAAEPEAGALEPERGAAGGEVLALGVLVLLVGLLLVAGAWRVVDAKLAASAGAREAARVLAERPTAVDAAVGAAREAVLAHGVGSARIAAVDAAAEARRCGLARGVVVVAVPPLGLPWVGGLPGVDVRADHVEVVDPLAADIPGEADCLG